MGADHSMKCDRIDARFKLAGELASQWMCGNREHVIRELGFTPGDPLHRVPRVSPRLLAAIGTMARSDVGVPCQQKAAGEIMEAIAREKF